MPLTTRRIAALTKPGLYGDGRNLWLKLTGSGTGSWVFRYSRNGHARAMGLGSLAEVSLEQARLLAAAARQQLHDGADPLQARAAARTAQHVAQARATTFRECADRYIDIHRTAWRTEGTCQIWRATLAKHAEPVLGHLPIGEVDTNFVMQILRPIWNRQPHTASKLRGRIEAILSFAIALGLRDGPNPALWRGHLQQLLPSPSKVQPVRHHPALDWHDIPAFMVQLRQDNNIGAKALEFLILTAARSGEARGATWDEIDLERAVWAIPGPRMKTLREHRVPLSEPALTLLRSMEPMRSERGPVFPGMKPGRGLSDQALAEVLQRLDYSEITVHGFRSSFRDWASEATGHANHVVELALAHAIPSAVEAAYRRGDLMSKRTVLMSDWAAFLARPAAEVVRLPAGRVAG